MRISTNGIIEGNFTPEDIGARHTLARALLPATLNPQPVTKTPSARPSPIRS
jgi:hypothetical protein